MTCLLRNAALTGSALLSTPVWAAPEPSPAPLSAPPAEVAIAYGKAGLKVGDAPIFRGPVDAAAWDSAQELLWFTNPEGGGAWGARPEGGGTCDGYVFSPSGTSHLTGRSVCRIAVTVACTQSEDWHSVGWYRGAAR